MGLLRGRPASHLVVVVAGSLAAIAVVPAGGAPPAPTGPHALTVLPPGEGNTITLDGYLRNQASGNCADLGPHTCDQMAMYRDWRFKSSDLSADADHVAGAVSEDDPLPGLRIVRDNAGVPHVFASAPDEQTIEDLIAYGIGYAQAQERLFQMEVFRRAGEGRLADLLGPAYLTMDVVTRRDTETAAEEQAQIEARLTPGQQRSLQRYSDGVNAIIARVTLDPSSIPAGFVLAQDLPIQPWTNTDTLAVEILETKAVAESAGNELGYASLARRLAQHHGVGAATGILDDIQLVGDPHTPTTIPPGGAALRTTDGVRYDFIRYTRDDTAQRIAELPQSVETAMHEVQSGDQAVGAATVSLGLPHFGSNAWAVAPSRSATGTALLWGAPQVSYYTPQVLDELEIDGGLTHVRGVGVPGGGPGVVIGFTPHTAWSITTAQDDQSDTYIDRIRPTSAGGYEYWWQGAWHPVQQRTETIRSRMVTPNLPLTGALAPPVYTERIVTYYRTAHGEGDTARPCVVEYIDTAGSVSYCKVRAFWGVELKTGLAIVGVNRAQTLDAFDSAVRTGAAGFNFMYADDAGHIAYWHTGLVPVRVPGHDPRLPVPGDGSFDWRGFLDPSLWPSTVDPAQGYLASWNNKPQRSWPDSGDGTLWGGVQRVAQPQRLLAAQPLLDQASLYGTARRTGELDLRATLGFKPFLVGLLQRTDLSPIERAAVQQVDAWDGTAFYPDGAERAADGTATGRVAAAGFPILSAWFHALERRAGGGVLLPAVGGDNVAQGVRAFTLTAGTVSPEFEFFDDYTEFLYDLMTGRAHSADYFGGASARDVSKSALDDAVAALRSAQGDDPSRWRAPMPQITFMALDVSGVGTLPWENRGTYGQAIVLGGNARTAAAASGTSPSPQTARAAPGGAGVVVLLAVAVACSLLRRRRVSSRSR